MEFRPCIDIHNGKVKQIIGGSLSDLGDNARENFVSCQDAAFFASMYKRDGIRGGHVIMLNAKDSEYYEATKNEALSALRAYPKGLQVGGSITPYNAGEFIDAGASHVIVTSYVFKGGRIDYDHLNEMCSSVGKDHLVLDVSCRKRGGKYYVVTDRWQNFTEEEVTGELLDMLSGYCSEFLVHAVDVEGKVNGIETELAALLGDWGRIPMTYAGGVADFNDLALLKKLGRDKLNVTIGSALDIFGGKLEYAKVLEYTADNSDKGGKE